MLSSLAVFIIAKSTNTACIWVLQLYFAVCWKNSPEISSMHAGQPGYTSSTLQLYYCTRGTLVATGDQNLTKCECTLATDMCRLKALCTYRCFQIARTYPAFANDEAQMLLDELRDDLVNDLVKQPTSNFKNPRNTVCIEEVPNLLSESPAQLTQMHGQNTSLLDASQTKYNIQNPEQRQARLLKVSELIHTFNRTCDYLVQQLRKHTISNAAKKCVFSTFEWRRFLGCASLRPTGKLWWEQLISHRSNK